MATISPCCGFSLAVSGMKSPPRICSVASVARTTTRSERGVTFVAVFVAISCFLLLGTVRGRRKGLLALLDHECYQPLSYPDRLSSSSARHPGREQLVADPYPLK